MTVKRAHDTAFPRASPKRRCHRYENCPSCLNVDAFRACAGCTASPRTKKRRTSCTGGIDRSEASASVAPACDGHARVRKRVRFASDTKSHDGLSPASALLEELVPAFVRAKLVRADDLWPFFRWLAHPPRQPHLAEVEAEVALLVSRLKAIAAARAAAPAPAASGDPRNPSRRRASGGALPVLRRGGGMCYAMREAELPRLGALVRLIVRTRHLLALRAAATAAASGPPAVDASGWLALVINLQRRADRLAAVRALEWGGVRLERLEGVEGSGLEWDGLVTGGDVHAQAAEQARWASSREVPTICRESGSFSPHLTLGAVGCALAHRAAWERLAASTSHDWALIAEDDLHAVAQPFASRLQRVLAALPPTWQICYIGYHETGGDVPSAADWAGGVAVAEVHAEESLTGLFGYLLRKAGARQLLGASGAVFPLHHQVDVALSRRAWPPGSRFAVPAARPLLGAPRSEEAACDTDVQTLGAPGKLAHDELLEGMLTL